MGKKTVRFADENSTKTYHLTRVERREKKKHSVIVKVRARDHSIMMRNKLTKEDYMAKSKRKLAIRERVKKLNAELEINI